MYGQKHSYTKENYKEVMLKYRVQKCTKSGCPVNCFGYHTEYERRRPPKHLTVRAQECPQKHINSEGIITCPNGEDCPYFHTITEWFHPATYKTRTHDPTTTCYVTVNYGIDSIYCSYLHKGEDDEELIAQARAEARAELEKEYDKQNRKYMKKLKKEIKDKKREKEDEEKKMWEEIDAMEKEDNCHEDDSEGESKQHANGKNNNEGYKKGGKVKQGKVNNGCKGRSPTPTSVTKEEKAGTKTVKRSLTPANSKTSSKKSLSPVLKPLSPRTKTPTPPPPPQQQQQQNNSKRKTPTPPPPPQEEEATPSHLNEEDDHYKENNNNLSNDASSEDNQEPELPRKSITIYEEYDELDDVIPTPENSQNAIVLKGEIVRVKPTWVQIKTTECGTFILNTSHLCDLPKDWEARGTVRVGMEISFNPVSTQQLSKSGNIVPFGCLLLPKSMNAHRSRPPFFTFQDARNVLKNKQANKLPIKLDNNVFELVEGDTVSDLRLQYCISKKVPFKNVAIYTETAMGHVQPCTQNSVLGTDVPLSQKMYVAHTRLHNNVCTENAWRAVVESILELFSSAGSTDCLYCCFEYFEYYLSSVLDINIEHKWLRQIGEETYMDTWLLSPNTFEPIYFVFYTDLNGCKSVRYITNSDLFIKGNIFAKKSNANTTDNCSGNGTPKVNSFYGDDYKEEEDSTPTYLPDGTIMVFNTEILDNNKTLTDSFRLTQRLFHRNKSTAALSYNPQTAQTVFYLPVYETSPRGGSSSTSKPRVLHAAEAQKVVAPQKKDSEQRTFLVVHRLVEPHIAYLNTCIAGTSVPQWLAGAAVMGLQRPLLDIATGMRCFGMEKRNPEQREILAKCSEDCLNYLVGARSSMASTQEELQEMCISAETAKNVVMGTYSCPVNSTLDFVCFECGAGAHLAFCALDSDSGDDHLYFVPYIKCNYCGNVVRTYDIPTISSI